MQFNLDAHGDAVALIDDAGVAYTYRELAGRVRLLECHLHPRSLLLLLARNTVSAIAFYVACVNHRVVPILMDHQTVVSALLDIVSTYSPRYIWAPDGLSSSFPGYQVRMVQDGCALLERVVGGDPVLHEALGILLTTSGSTGSPKLVRISYGNLQANTLSIAEYLQLSAADRTISTLPFNYSYGLSIVNTYLYMGASIVLTEASLMQREFWELFRQHHVHSLSGVPYTYEMLKRMRFDRMDLPQLTTLTQAGGKLDDALCREFAQAARTRGWRFFVMYGATEATARMSYLPPHHAVDKAGSIGIAIPGGQFSIIGDDGAPVIPGQVGQLVYRGPNVALGYAETASDLARGDDFAGVLVTGDLAKRDDDGYYFIVGRVKRIIKMFGVRTSLDEVERMVNAVRPGLDVACTGMDNQLRVYVNDEAVCKFLHEHLSKMMRVARSAISVHYIPVFPRSPAGKVLYAQLEGEAPLAGLTG